MGNRKLLLKLTTFFIQNNPHLSIVFQELFNKVQMANRARDFIQTNLSILSTTPAATESSPLYIPFVVISVDIQGPVHMREQRQYNVGVQTLPS